MAKVLTIPKGDELRKFLMPAKQRTRHESGRMNKTETEYSQTLEWKKQGGEVLAYWFESMNLRLADNKCWFAVDFMVLLADGSMELVDVKAGGGTEDDALVKVKVAAALYWQFKFVTETKTKSGWVRREF